MLLQERGGCRPSLQIAAPYVPGTAARSLQAPRARLPSAGCLTAHLSTARSAARVFSLGRAQGSPPPAGWLAGVSASTPHGPKLSLARSSSELCLEANLTLAVSWGGTAPGWCRAWRPRPHPQGAAGSGAPHPLPSSHWGQRPRGHPDQPNRPQDPVL